MIDHKRKLLFVHIPKNAGTSIERIVFDTYNFSNGMNREFLYGFDDKLQINLQHATLTQMIQLKLISEEIVHEYHSFAVVRNPFTRAISSYIWLLKDLNIEGSFDQFLKREGTFSNAALSRTSIYVLDHLYTQSEFVSLHNEIAVKKILRFESLASDFASFTKELSLPIPFALNTHFKKNKISKWKLSRFFTPENIALIKEIYKDDFLNFGYTFTFNKLKYKLGYV